MGEPIRCQVTTRHGHVVEVVMETTFRWYTREQELPGNGHVFYRIKGGGWRTARKELSLQQQGAVRHGVVHVTDIADCLMAIPLHLARHGVAA